MSDKKVDYKEEKTIRWKIDDFEFHTIVMDADTLVEAGFDLSLTKVGGQAKKDKHKAVLATVIKDPEFGLMPFDVWQEKRRRDIAGTISPHMNAPFTSGDIALTTNTAATRSYTGLPEIPCPKCGRYNPVKNSFCGHCGYKINPAQSRIVGEKRKE